MDILSIMSNLLIIFMNYLLTYWSSLYVETIIVTSVGAALISLLKCLTPLKKLKGRLIYRVLFAWLSVILTIGLTLVYALLGDLALSDIWAHFIVNCISMILGYWFYESTAAKNGINRILSIVKSKITHKNPKSLHEVKDTFKDIHTEVESLLSSKSPPEHKYSDEDLKNL